VFEGILHDCTLSMLLSIVKMCLHTMPKLYDININARLLNSLEYNQHGYSWKVFGVCGVHVVFDI
jgi:hypothetical protein